MCTGGCRRGDRDGRHGLTVGRHGQLPDAHRLGVQPELHQSVGLEAAQLHGQGRPGRHRSDGGGDGRLLPRLRLLDLHRSAGQLRTRRILHDHSVLSELRVRRDQQTRRQRALGVDRGIRQLHIVEPDRHRRSRAEARERHAHRLPGTHRVGVESELRIDHRVAVAQVVVGTRLGCVTVLRGRRTVHGHLRDGRELRPRDRRGGGHPDVAGRGLREVHVLPLGGVLPLSRGDGRVRLSVGRHRDLVALDRTVLVGTAAQVRDAVDLLGGAEVERHHVRVRRRRRTPPTVPERAGVAVEHVRGRTVFTRRLLGARRHGDLRVGDAGSRGHRHLLGGGDRAHIAVREVRRGDPDADGRSRGRGRCGDQPGGLHAVAGRDLAEQVRRAVGDLDRVALRHLELHADVLDGDGLAVGEGGRERGLRTGAQHTRFAGHRRAGSAAGRRAEVGDREVVQHEVHVRSPDALESHPGVVAASDDHVLRELRRLQRLRDPGAAERGRGDRAASHRVGSGQPAVRTARSDLVVEPDAVGVSLLQRNERRVGAVDDSVVLGVRHERVIAVERRVHREPREGSGIERLGGVAPVAVRIRVVPARDARARVVDAVGVALHERPPAGLVALEIVRVHRAGRERRRGVGRDAGIVDADLRVTRDGTDGDGDLTGCRSQERRRAALVVLARLGVGAHVVVRRREVPGARHRTGAGVDRDAHVTGGGGVDLHLRGERVPLPGSESGHRLRDRRRGCTENGDVVAPGVVLRTAQVGALDCHIPLRVPDIERAGVEPGVVEAGVAVLDGRTLRAALGHHHVGRSLLCTERQLTACRVDRADLDAPLVAELEHVEGGVAAEGLGEAERLVSPGGRVEVHLVGVDGRAGVLVGLQRLPRQQVRVAAQHRGTVHRDDPGAAVHAHRHVVRQGRLGARLVGEQVEVLQELGRQALLPDVVDEAVPVAVADPALGVDQSLLPEQGVVVPDVGLPVLDEAHHGGVDALVVLAAVGQVVRPVRPDRAVDELVAPLGRDLEVHAVQLVRELFGDPPVGVVHVDVDAAEAGDLVAQLLEAVEHPAGSEVGLLVDVVRLVEPVPARLVRGRAVEDRGVEGVRLRIDLGGVDVHAHVGVELRALVDEVVQVGEAARALVVVPAVVGVRRVVAFTAVTLVEHPLAETVRLVRDALGVVEHQVEVVRRAGGEVEGDAADHALGDPVGSETRGVDLAVADRGILPVDPRVGVAVGGEEDGHLGQGVRRHPAVDGGGRMDQPGAGADLGRASCGLGHTGGQAGVPRCGAAGGLGGRVGDHAAHESPVAEECEGRTLLPGRRRCVHRDVLIGVLRAVGADHRAIEHRPGIRGTRGEEGVVGKTERGHGRRALDRGDLEPDGAVLRDADAAAHGDVDARQRRHVVDSGGRRRRGGLRRVGGAVDRPGLRRGALAGDALTAHSVPGDAGELRRDDSGRAAVGDLDRLIGVGDLGLGDDRRQLLVGEDLDLAGPTARGPLRVDHEQGHVPAVLRGVERDALLLVVRGRRMKRRRSRGCAPPALRRRVARDIGIIAHVDLDRLRGDALPPLDRVVEGLHRERPLQIDDDPVRERGVGGVPRCPLRREISVERTQGRAVEGWRSRIGVRLARHRVQAVVGLGDRDQVGSLRGWRLSEHATECERRRQQGAEGDGGAGRSGRFRHVLPLGRGDAGSTDAPVRRR